MIIKDIRTMKIAKHSSRITDKEEKLIQANYKAFVFNFDIEPIIFKYPHGSFEIYLSEDKISDGEYIQYCDNVDYLNGWLYGAVQAKCGRIQKS